MSSLSRSSHSSNLRSSRSSASRARRSPSSALRMSSATLGAIESANRHQLLPAFVEGALIVFRRAWDHDGVVAQPIAGPAAPLAANAHLVVERLISGEGPAQRPLDRGPILHIVLLGHARWTGIAQVIAAQHVLHGF